MTWTDRISEAWEDLKVRWFMLDAQKKQIVLLAGLYLAYTLLDIGGALAKARIMAKGTQ